MPAQQLAGSAVVAATIRPAPALRPGARVLGLLRVLVPGTFAGYALFDRAFAYLHIPGTPLFLGEAVLVVMLLALVVATPYASIGLGRSMPMALLAAFMLWGALRTVPLMGRYGLDSLRDASLWYYALAALVVPALAAAWSDLPERWARWFTRLLPWLLLWGAIAVLLVGLAGNKQMPPYVPDTGISIFSHKQGNVAVFAAMALAYMWMVPAPYAPARGRATLTALGTLVILAVATQNRGGMVAAVAGLGVALLMARDRLRLVLPIIATLAMVLALGWGLGLRLTGEQQRDFSVAQLVENIGSISGQADDSRLKSNVDFRNELWSGVIARAGSEDTTLEGEGFGPNVAAELGLQGEGAAPLRSPHNSHIDVFVRMGIVGVVLWVVFWASWYGALVRGRRRLRAAGMAVRAGLAGTLVVGVTAILVNSYFDPGLESPQVAYVLWTLVGLGIALVPRTGAGAVVQRSLE